MSRHEGVSCDSCLKNNFKGKRFKCLICYDYDLCWACHEEGRVTARHRKEHPVQCILTRNDYELHYAGEISTAESTQSYVCPSCGKMGFTEAQLVEHIATHSQIEAICPICAAGPVNRPNIVREDLNGHLNLQHRNALMTIFDDNRVRRIPLPVNRSNARGRRANVHFGAIPINNDNSYPIAEFLSHLTVVRRSQNPAVERNRVSRHEKSVKKSSTNLEDVQVVPQQSQFLLPKILPPPPTEDMLQTVDEERIQKSLFLKQILLSSIRSIKGAHK